MKTLLHLGTVGTAVMVFLNSISQAQEPTTLVPTTDFEIPDDLELSIWATSPFLFNPTNMDTDRMGRIWVTEGVNYRRTMTRPKGDRIVVLEDTDQDGTADSSHVFIQDTELVSPLGISVFDNKIVVAQPPSILVYTDIDRNLKFDPAIDTREELVTGFNGKNHDHSLHATIAGPDGKWYFNQGNCGARIQDKEGRIFQSGGPYYKKGGGSPEWFNDTRSYAGKPSADGNIYQGGFAGRMNPDGSNIQIIGHGFRNSYELCLSSFGDIFQNDNDDPPACRNTWLMEGGNLGFFSKDGTRTWQADRRPGQPIAIAHWRQEDPGILPAGDVYGAGSPTGMSYYENGALPQSYEGMLLSCEARARVIQRYHPTLSTNSSEVDLGNRSNLLRCDANHLFRPSDIMVGADGALYISDWFDPGVGGHRAADVNHSGTIYRLAPKGFKPAIPPKKQNAIEDALTLLKSPAPHVRYIGFENLKTMGSTAFESVKALSESTNRWYAARAIWLLPYLGTAGVTVCHDLLENPDSKQRILAFRALRSAGHDVIQLGRIIVKDKHPAVRRALAVALRDLQPKKKMSLVIELWNQFDGNDSHYLEACGLASEDIEEYVWKQLVLSQPSNPMAWSTSFQKLTWRLSTEASVPSLIRRANSGKLTNEERKFAMESLAFIGNKAAVDGIIELANSPGELGQHATWWLLNRGNDEWAKFGTKEVLKDLGIYDPDTVELTPITVPSPPETNLPSPAEIAKLPGNVSSGKIQSTRCTMCHKIGNEGIDYGPNLKNWVGNQGLEAFFEAVIFPSRSIAHGFMGSTIFLKNGDQIQGLLYSELDPVSIMSTGGVQQMVPRSRIKNIRRRSKISLMLSADQLGMSAQNLADLGAFMLDLDQNPQQFEASTSSFE